MSTDVLTRTELNECVFFLHAQHIQDLSSLIFTHSLFTCSLHLDSLWICAASVHEQRPALQLSPPAALYFSVNSWHAASLKNNGIS